MSPSILTIDGWADRIAAAPDDAELRGVFEDWLRERGHDAVVDWLHHHELENLKKSWMTLGARPS